MIAMRSACLAIFGLLFLAERRGTTKLGQTFALYVALYTFARFWFENMRIDPAHDPEIADNVKALQVEGGGHHGMRNGEARSSGGHEVSCEQSVDDCSASCAPRSRRRASVTTGPPNVHGAGPIIGA